MSRGARAARGTAVAVFATFVAALAHTLGGGAPPGPVALAVALAFSAPLAMVLTGARARMLRTAVSAVAAQGLLHLTYAVGSPAVPAARFGPPAVHPVASVDHGDAWMPIAHLAAAALTLAALVAGDRVFDAAAGALCVFVRRLTSIPVPLAAPRVTWLGGAPRPRPTTRLLISGLGSRGPPTAIAAP